MYENEWNPETTKIQKTCVSIWFLEWNYSEPKHLTLIYNESKILITYLIYFSLNFNYYFISIFKMHTIVNAQEAYLALDTLVNYCHQKWMEVNVTTGNILENYYIINYLRDNWLLRWIKRVKCSSGLHSCHVYSITERLQAILNELKELKKEFTYITYTPDDVINYVSSFAKKKYWQWKFEREWILYIVADRWKWRWKIYDTVNNRIVSLITVQNAN